MLTSIMATIKTKATKMGRFTIVQDLVKIGDRILNYDYLQVKEGVCVLALDQGKIVVQKQYRYPLKSWQWEFPGGFIDPGETPQRAAMRELQEETGYLCGRIETLGCFYPSFGSTDEKIHLFVVECGAKQGATKEPGELIEQSLVTKKEFEKMIKEGAFCHGAGLAAWAKYLVAGND